MAAESLVYERPATLAEALELLRRPGYTLLGGGTTLVDLMRLGVARPAGLVDTRSVPELGGVVSSPEEWSLGGAVTMAEVLRHHTVCRELPALAESLALAASTQIRNTATLAGNLMQAPRCVFFRDVRTPCHRRDGGGACSALATDIAPRALLVDDDPCVAPDLGDLGTAAVALDASVETVANGGAERMSVEELLRVRGPIPGNRLITRLVVPRRSGFSAFVKRRDRRSFAFGSASCAAWAAIEEGVVREVRVAVGAQSTRPRRLVAVEREVLGRALTTRTIESAAQHALAGQELRHGTDAEGEWHTATVRQALTCVGERSLM